MNLSAFTIDWLMRSFAVGAIAATAVFACPAAWRGSARRAVPFAAFLALLLLPLGTFAPVRISIPATLALPTGTAADFNWLALLWLAGTIICLARLASGTHTINALLKATCAVPGEDWADCLAAAKSTLGLRGKIHLGLAGPGFIPSATGLLRRTILLPDEATQWTIEQRRLVLLHELGHFRRGDLWIHALGRIACAFHWFNPFAWLLQHLLSVEREYAVDALVVKHGISPKAYATVLWQMAKAATRRPTTAAAYLAMAQPGKLEQRVQRILTPERRKSGFFRLIDAAICLTATALFVFCTACRPSAQAHPADYTQEEVQMRLAADPFPGE